MFFLVFRLHLLTVCAENKFIFQDIEPIQYKIDGTDQNNGSRQGSNLRCSAQHRPDTDALLHWAMSPCTSVSLDTRLLTHIILFLNKLTVLS